MWTSSRIAVSRAQIGCLIGALALLAATASCSKPNRESYLSKANQLAASGQYDEAILNYKKALQSDPNFGEAYFRLGNTWAAKSNLGEAYSALQKANEMLPEREDVAIAFAEVCVAGYLSDRAGLEPLLRSAESVMTRLLQKSPASFEVYRVAAQVELAAGKTAAAVDHLRKASELRPWQPPVMLSLVDALLAQGKKAEAEALGAEAIAKAPGFVPLYELMHKHFQSSGRPKEAEGILELRIRNNPKDSAAVLRLCEHYRQHNPAAVMGCVERLSGAGATGKDLLDAGDFLRQSGNTAAAIARYEQGERMGGPTQVLHVTRIVETLVGAARIQEARSKVEGLLAREPQNANWRRMRAELDLEGSDSAKSIAELEALSSQFANDPQYWHSMGRAYQSRKESTKAAKAFEKALALDRNYQAPRLALASMLTATGRHRDALARIREGRALDPVDMKLRLAESANLAAVGELDKAEALLEAAAKEEPANPEVQIQMAYLLLAKGESQRAESIFTRLLAGGKSKDLRVPLGLAQVLAANERLDAALQVLDASGGAGVRDVEQFRATLLFRMKRHAQAIEIYQRLLAKNPNDGELHVRLGEVQYALGDVASAAASFEKSELLSKGDVTPSLGSALVRVSKGDHRGAIEIYRKVLAKEPKNAVAMNNLAYELAEHGGDLDEALKLASRATEIEPGVNDFADTLGWVQLKKNQNALARKTFEALVRRDPRNAGYRYHLGAALAAEGSRQRAVTELSEALKLQPAPADARQIEAMLRKLR